MIALGGGRQKAIRQISGLMLVFLLLSAVANALQGRYDFSILYLFAIAATLIHLFFVYRRPNTPRDAESLMRILFPLFFAFFLIGEHSTFDVLWVLILPAVAVIVEDYRHTRLWVMRFLALLVGLVLLNTLCSRCLPYEGFALWSLLWAGIFLSGMALYYKRDQEMLENEIASYQSGLERKIGEAVREIKALNDDLDATQIEILERLGTLGEYRSKETGMHVRRVGLYTRTLALLSGLDEAEAKVLERAAPLHDIGKVGIEDSILHKPAALTDAEFERMKQHTLIGEAILGGSDKPLLQRASEIAGGHHEKFDGSGYPRGLRGDAIPLGARLVTIADVFDALYSKRSYKEGWSSEEVVQYFENQSGRHFDPELSALFLRNMDRFIAIYDANQGD